MRHRIPFSLILSLILFSCNPDKNRIVDRTSPVYKTNDASRLFFKNVRLLYYDIEEVNEGKIQILKLGSRVEDSTSAIINIDIVNNWFQDKAYPMIRLGSFFDEMEIIEIEMTSRNGFSEVLQFDKNSSIDEHFYFATALYEGILKGYEFRLLNNNITLLRNSDEREALRITMVDFYRLVAIY